MVANGIRSLGGNAWTYKEGSNRSVYIVEFSKSFLKEFEIVSERDKIDYIRGYFDADGGVAKSSKVRFYIYFAQKDYSDLEQVRNYLKEIRIDCGVIHNPSKRIDPYYWRFFVKAKSYVDFVQKIGSLHPEKAKYLWMKI
ncbi:MAG: LAGLIDADG homing endonuclease [Candidatus Collierbacteria bacterium GW2011_GWF1_44_12]|nr:MAG: LAGLIDADG homing endonuclease [Candidatus Collierbacteria bacterium GW2011_GWF1_44_12]